MVHTLLAVYTVMLAHHALAGKRETKGLADYYVGGRNMGGWVIGLSFFATYASTNSFVGFAGQTYDWGLPWLLFIPTAIAFCLFAWIVVAPKLRSFTEAMESLTIPDFIGFRFGSVTARVMAALIVIVASLFYMTAVFKGIGNLIEQFLDIPYTVSIVIVFFIVMLYTVIGGFISVVKTDAVQGVVMVIAAILLFVGTVNAAGGLGAIHEVRAQPEIGRARSRSGAKASSDGPQRPPVVQAALDVTLVVTACLLALPAFLLTLYVTGREQSLPHLLHRAASEFGNGFANGLTLTPDRDGWPSWGIWLYATFLTAVLPWLWVGGALLLRAAIARTAPAIEKIDATGLIDVENEPAHAAAGLAAMTAMVAYTAAVVLL
jgi:Na+/pantothenate symporter